MICFDGLSPTQLSFQKEECCRVNTFRFLMRAKASISPRQQSFPLHGTSYFKTKAFSYCIPSTHTPYLLSLSSARSSCVLHTVAQITPEFPEHCGRYRDENDVGLYHICYMVQTHIIWLGCLWETTVPSMGNQSL